jgi:hypothetical protein
MLLSRAGRGTVLLQWSSATAKVDEVIISTIFNLTHLHKCKQNLSSNQIEKKYKDKNKSCSYFIIKIAIWSKLGRIKHVKSDKRPGN